MAENLFFLFNMTKKKIVEAVNELPIEFTGKMSIIIELENYGPMEYRLDSKDVCVKVLRLLIQEMGPTTSVNSYNKRTENTFKKILDF